MADCEIIKTCACFKPLFVEICCSITRRFIQSFKANKALSSYISLYEIAPLPLSKYFQILYYFCYRKQMFRDHHRCILCGGRKLICGAGQIQIQTPTPMCPSPAMETHGLCACFPITRTGVTRLPAHRVVVESKQNTVMNHLAEPGS